MEFMKKYQCPRHLSPEAKKMFAEISKMYNVSVEWFSILKTALETYDSYNSGRETIKRDGKIIKDRFGEMKSHPLIPSVEKDRLALLKFWKMLNIDNPEKPITKGG
jgi:phage terminase small subunit